MKVIEYLCTAYAVVTTEQRKDTAYAYNTA